MVEGDIHGGGDVAHADGDTEQPVEQLRNPRPRRPDVRPNGLTEPRVGRSERPRTERDHRPARRRIAQRIEGAAPRRRIVHDDRGERFTERGLDGRSPVVVDLDEVEQRAEHAVDADEPFGAGPGTRRVECELERIHPGGRPRRGVGIVRLQRTPGLGECGGRFTGRLGGLDLGDQ